MTANMHEILLAATGADPRGEGEAQQSYLLRLVYATDDLNDGPWASLPAVVQVWFNAAVEEVRGAQAISLLPGMVDES